MATSPDQATKTLATDYAANVASVDFVVAETNNARRSLRVNEGNAISIDGDSIDNDNDIGSEERGKSFKEVVSKVISGISTTTPEELFGDTRLQSWVESERPLDYIMKRLKLHGLPEAELETNPNYKYLDRFWDIQVKEWQKQDLSLDNVLQKLGLDTLQVADRAKAVTFKCYEKYVNLLLRQWSSDKTATAILVNLGINHQLSKEELETDLNFQLFDKFWNVKVTEWTTQDLSVDDVLEKLGLNRLKTQPDATRPHTVLDTYYETFMESRFEIWMSDKLTATEMMVQLGIDQLSGEALEADLNFQLFDKFWNAKVAEWKTQDLCLDDVLEKLGLNRLKTQPGADGPHDVIYTYYEMFMESRFEIWASKELTANEVLVRLGIDQLSEKALEADPRFKYFDEFWMNEVEKWGKDPDISVVDVSKRLNLDKLKSDKERVKAVGCKYYDEFVSDKLKPWLKSDKTVDDVMKWLKLEDLRGDELLTHLNYRFYRAFVKLKMKSWAGDMLRSDKVRKRLGLKNLEGEELTDHPNYIFMKMYDKFNGDWRDEFWLKEYWPTLKVWTKLKLRHWAKLRQSVAYAIYREYVINLDRSVLEQHGLHDIPDHLKSNQDLENVDYIGELNENVDYIGELNENVDYIGELNEKVDYIGELYEKVIIWIDEEVPSEYVKNSLGLQGLNGNELENAPNFKYFRYFLNGVKVQVIHREKIYRKTNPKKEIAVDDGGHTTLAGKAMYRAFKAMYRAYKAEGIPTEPV